MNIYIYKIINKKKQSTYIGIRRIEGDIYKDNYKGENTILRKDFRKYGKKSFSSEVLAKDLTEDLAKFLILEYKKILKATILEDIESEDELKVITNKGKSSGKKRKVICLNNEKVFDSTVEASTYYGLKRTSVARACSKGVFTGKDLETGEKLKWMYYDVYMDLKEKNIDINNYWINNTINEESISDNTDMILDTSNLTDITVTSDIISNTDNDSNEGGIVCTTTNKRFSSIQEASEYYGVSASAIERCCNGRRSFAGLEPNTREKLIWQYSN